MFLDDIDAPRCTSSTGKPKRLLSFVDNIDRNIKKYLPKTQEDFFSRIHSTINRLQDKDQTKISETYVHILIYMLLPTSAITNIEVKTEAAESIAEMENGAQIITNYMRFLREYMKFLRELGQGCEKLLKEVQACYRYMSTSISIIFHDK